jgi:hypothetical protein
MASVRAPILQRPRNFQWYWNKATDPWTYQGAENWQKYTDVENEIIEDAYNEKKSDVEIDNDYIINLKNQVQYKKNDSKRQRPIKRFVLDRDRSNVHLREGRFSVPVATCSVIQADKELEEKDELSGLWNRGNLPETYYRLELKKKDKTFSLVAQNAAQGLIKEGSALNQLQEAKWLAKQLLAVQSSGIDIKTNGSFKIPTDIGQTCVYIYTKESFWYKLINRILRDPQTITREQVNTIGPFCFLLDCYLTQNDTGNVLTVYRGLDLTDQQREDFMKYLTFTSFTSTSRNRELAENFGNTLLIIDLDVKDHHSWSRGNARCGASISSLSDFPGAQEFLIWTDTQFSFVKHEDDILGFSRDNYQEIKKFQKQACQGNPWWLKMWNSNTS